MSTFRMDGLTMVSADELSKHLNGNKLDSPSAGLRPMLAQRPERISKVPLPFREGLGKGCSSRGFGPSPNLSPAGRGVLKCAPEN
jgi:hypothetical protein